MSPDRVAASLITVALLLTAGCDTSPSPSSSSLRVVNVGARSIEDLVVMFPNDRIGFGNIASGTTTAYRATSGGVYAYAAYEFRMADSVHRQPVIDWVGEKRVTGQAFTYNIELVESSLPSGINIRLVSATRDR